MVTAALDGERTAAKLLVANRAKWRDRVWMRKKELGFWKEYTWEEGYQRVKNFSLGLKSLGFQGGDVMAIVGDNDPHWFWAELAAQALGGAITGVFSSSGANEVKYFLQLTDAKIIVVEDQEQVDKVLQIKGELPLVKKIIYWDQKGLRRYDDTLLASFDAVSELGVQFGAQHPEMFEEEVSKGKGSDVVMIIGTSGTTGYPKGAIFSNDALFSSNHIFYSLNPMDENDEWVSFILPGWMAEQGMGFLGSLVRGVRMNFPESQETVQENIREIGASVLLYQSRLWENMASNIQNKISESTLLKRWIYNIFMPVGYKIADAQFKGEKPALIWRMLDPVARVMLFDPLKDKLGFSRLRYAFTTGALLGPDVFRMITAIGIDIRQLYGSSESGVSMHMRGDIKFDTVGRITPETIVRVMDDDHILVRGTASALGYYKNPKATEAAFAGGWFHTGDAGYIDDTGHVYYLDRLEYMSNLSDGTRYAPQYIEARLKFSPFVKDAFVVGDEKRDFIGAVINIHYDNVGHWAEKKQIPYTTFADLSQKPQVLGLISQEIRKLNGRLPKSQAIRRFLNMPKELDPDESELTRTMKLRRRFVEDRYKEFISALYGAEESAVVEVPVVYRDGRQGVIRAEIKVNRID
jgi:long-chain acyl-CoA synthetase